MIWATVLRVFLLLTILVVFGIIIFFCGRSSQNDNFMPNENFVLTFDDGPHPIYTLKIAEICKKNNIPAIFFCLGCKAEKYPDIVKQVSDMGFEIGTHGMDHVRHDLEGYNYNYRSLSQSKDILQKITKKPVKRFRPPYGKRFMATMQAEKATDLQHTGWSSCSDDWKDKTTSEKIQHALSTLNKGGIILLHDTIPETLEMLPEFIQACQRKNKYKLNQHWLSSLNTRA